MRRSIYSLRILIPVIVFSVTLLLILLITVERMREGEREILRSLTETAGAQMNQLQELLSDSLLKGDLVQARQRLSYAALSPQITTLVLVDADHHVLIANNQDLVNTDAAEIPHYDRKLAENATLQQQGNLSVTGHQHIHGYYPVTLGVRAGEIRPLRSGTLYVEYDFTSRLNLLKDEASISAFRLAALFLLFALILSYLLHVLITRPVGRLILTVNEFAGGNLEIRAAVHGSQETAQLAAAFNDMAEQLARSQEELHQQNVQLEEEVAERQVAQEALQDQAMQLEAEVSERQMAQETLEEQSQQLEEEMAERRQAEEKLRIIFDAAQAGIIMIDAAGIITFANRCVSNLYGYEIGEMIGSSYVEHVHADERKTAQERIESLIRGDIDSISAERHYLRNEEGEFWGIINAKRHLDEAGRLVAIIIVITDVTELRNAQSERDELQQKFNQAQKMEAIGRLAGGVAHDFNNKLSIIMGYAELLKMKMKNPDEEDIGRLDEVLKAANHSSEITRKLLAFSRSEVISPHKVVLNSLIEDSRKSLGRLIGEDIRLEFKPAAGLWPNLLDPTQIDQIIMNLAVNARDAMPEGGLLEIETANVHIDESYCHSFPDVQPGDYVQLTVSDSGCGMDSETLRHIFEPFYTTKEADKGTGLGLATIFGIVSQNKGFINVYSEIGLGTTFKLYFPRLTQEGEPDGHDAAVAAVHGSGTILLVEDEESLRKLAAEMLKELGYNVLEALSPDDALEQCRTGEAGNIDLILTDVIMPGMNGKEMSDRIRELRRTIPVLFMSGYAADVIASKGILENIEHFIQKPFSLQKLSKMIHEAISSEPKKD